MLISLDFLLNIALVLLVGFVCITIANRLKIPHAVPLIIAGFLMNLIKFRGEPLIVFPRELMYGFTLIALCIIAFDAASRVRIAHLSTEIKTSLSLALFTAGFNILVLTPVVQLLFFREAFYSLNLWLGSMIFSIVMSEISLDTVSVSYQKVKDRTVQLLEQESVINTPLFLFLVVFILYSAGIFGNEAPLLLDSQAGLAFLAGLALSLASALLIGIVFFRFMRAGYSETYSPFALIAGVLATYVIAEMVGADGLLAVLFVGLFFGRVYVKNKMLLEEFSSLFAALIEIVVFLLLGLILALEISLHTFLLSLVVYMAVLLLRYLAVLVSVNRAYGFRERLFFALNTPKGISVAVVALFLSFIPGFYGMAAIVELMVLVMFYSLLVHALVMRKKKVVA